MEIFYVKKVFPLALSITTSTLMVEESERFECRKFILLQELF